MIKTDEFVKWMGILMTEAFGLSDSESGYFLDDGQSGLLGAINGLSAQAASTALKPEDATIASHTGHVLFILGLFNAYERGERPVADWAGSWKTRVVTEAEWQTLRNELRAAYDTVQTNIAARTDWAEQPLAAALMLLAHCSYHVGEIRQLLTTIRSM